MKILIVGAVAVSLAGKQQSPKVDKVFVAPGNPGTALLLMSPSLSTTSGILAFAVKEHIDLTIIGRRSRWSWV